MKHHSFASNYFSIRTLRALARKGIYFLYAAAAPAFDGDRYYSGTVFCLSVDGQGQVKTFEQVLAMAQ